MGHQRRVYETCIGIDSLDGIMIVIFYFFIPFVCERLGCGYEYTYFANYQGDLKSKKSSPAYNKMVCRR